jgi:hypothetical protein
MGGGTFIDWQHAPLGRTGQHRHDEWVRDARAEGRSERPTTQVAFRSIAANDHSDHNRIAPFRQRRLED